MFKIWTISNTHWRRIWCRWRRIETGQFRSGQLFSNVEVSCLFRYGFYDSRKLNFKPLKNRIEFRKKYKFHLTRALYSCSALSRYRFNKRNCSSLNLLILSLVSLISSWMASRKCCVKFFIFTESLSEMPSNCQLSLCENCVNNLPLLVMSIFVVDKSWSMSTPNNFEYLTSVFRLLVSSSFVNNKGFTRNKLLSFMACVSGVNKL